MARIKKIERNQEIYEEERERMQMIKVYFPSQIGLGKLRYRQGWCPNFRGVSWVLVKQADR